MSDFTKTTDYTALFEYATLQKINGEPDYTQLKNLLEKLKANATKISGELGGGTFGHLGLVLPPTEYANISAVPFIKPRHPGNLVLPYNLTERNEDFRRATHKK